MPVIGFDEGKNKEEVYKTTEIDSQISLKQDKHVRTEITLTTTWDTMSDVGGDQNYHVQTFTIDGLTSQSTVIIQPKGSPTANVQAFEDAGIYFRKALGNILVISYLGTAPESEIIVEVIVLN